MPVVINSDFTNGANAVNEVQIISVGTGGAGGTFQIGGQAVTYVDDLEDMETNVAAALTAQDPDLVLIFSEINGGNYDYHFEYTGASAGTDQGHIYSDAGDTGVSVSVSTLTNGSAASQATQDLTFTPAPSEGAWTFNSISFDWDETPVITGWTISGTAASGLVQCTKDATGSTTELTYDEGTLEAVYEATADLQGSTSYVAAELDFSAGAISGTSALSGRTSLIAATMDTQMPIATSAMILTTSTLSSSLTFTAPVYTAAVSLSGATSALTIAATFAPGTKTAAASLTGTTSLLASSITYAVPVFTATVALVSIRSILRAREVLLDEGPKVYVEGGRRSITMMGISTGKFKFSPTAFSSGKRNHIIHLTNVKPEFATVEGLFTVLTISPFIHAGAFRYTAPGDYLIIENESDIELTLLPDDTVTSTISLSPVTNDLTNGLVFSTLHQP